MLCHRSLGDILKQNFAKVYPTETNSYLILLAMSIFVVHIYACSNTISWQLFYLCFSVVLGFDIFFRFCFFCFFVFFSAQLVGEQLGLLSLVSVQMWSRLKSSCDWSSKCVCLCYCASYYLISIFCIILNYVCIVSAQSWYHNSACNHDSLILLLILLSK